MGERHLVIKQQLELSIVSRPAFNDVEHGWQPVLPCPSMIQPGFPSFLPTTFAIGGVSFGNLVGQKTRLDHGPCRTGLPIIGGNEVDFRKTRTKMLPLVMLKNH